MAEEATSGDLHSLFCHYNCLYFGDGLGACVVSWSSSPPLDSCTGTCDYHPDGGCEIRISEPLLKFRPTSDLKNALLHEMIHARLFIKNKSRDHSDHDSSFKGMMDAINSSLVEDYEKPPDGYKITIYHGFEDGVDDVRVQQSNFGSSGDPTRAIDGVLCHNVRKSGYGESCGNSLCCAHSHKKLFLDGEAEELTGSKDGKVSPIGDQEPPKGRYKGLQYRRGTRRSCRLEGVEEKLNDQKAIAMTDFIPSEDGADINQGSIPSSDGPEQKIECANSKVTAIKSHAITPEIPKRVRTVPKKKKQKYGGRKSRKSSTHKNEYSVIIKWLDVHTDEEVEEDLEPLIHKRTERRKKLKLLKDQVFPSHTSVNSQEHKPLLNSPAIEDFIDISDG